MFAQNYFANQDNYAYFKLLYGYHIYVLLIATTLIMETKCTWKSAIIMIKD